MPASERSHSFNEEQRATEDILSKIGSIALTTAFALLTGVGGYAADSEGTASQERSSKITLTCTGTLMAKDTEPPFEKFPVSPQSVVIDVDRGSVSGSIGEYGITKHAETSIVFSATADNGDKSTGGVDRYSGSLIVTRWRGKQIVSNYNLSCKPAKPLF